MESPFLILELGSLRAHPPIVFLRYTLHVFSHTVDLLAHHTFFGFFSFFFFFALHCAQVGKNQLGGDRFCMINLQPCSAWF
uniref:Uncharacterized protein n=1 Tax=Buteo japonicus TaxID=224669 RepID=A0A8C0AWR8_9AVES